MVVLSLLFIGLGGYYLSSRSASGALYLFLTCLFIAPATNARKRKEVWVTEMWRNPNGILALPPSRFTFYRKTSTFLFSWLLHLIWFFFGSGIAADMKVNPEKELEMHITARKVDCINWHFQMWKKSNWWRARLPLEWWQGGGPLFCRVVADEATWLFLFLPAMDWHWQRHRQPHPTTNQNFNHTKNFAPFLVVFSNWIIDGIENDVTTVTYWEFKKR